MMARSVRRNGMVVWGDGSLKEKPTEKKRRRMAGGRRGD
jgi:hypothetical protein